MAAFGNQPTTQGQATPFGGFSFSGASTTPSLSTAPFPSTSNPGTQIGFGTPLPTTTPSIFGGSTTTAFTPVATTTSLFPTLGQTATTSTAGFSFGGFGTTPAQSISFGTAPTPGTTIVSTAPVSIGLGGVDIQPSTGIDPATGIVKRDKAVKETAIPNELAVVVEAFKKYIKDQKSIKEEMCRYSSKNILRVQSQMLALRNQLSIVSNGLQRHLASNAKLKEDTADEIKNVEIAQRTKDTPPSLQFENSAPSTYFHNLSISFENQMQSYRQQIELLEKHLTSLAQPSPMTPDELTIVVKKLHDAFVTLAAQLHTVHQQVQHQKELFRAIQKAGSNELGDIFDLRKKNLTNLDKKIYQQLPSSVLTTSGSNTVIGMPTSGSFGKASTKTRIGDASGSFLSISQISGFNLQNTGTPFKLLGQPAVPSFGSPNFVGFSNDNSLSSNNQRPFQLQKPPSGNKRGKRWTAT